MNFFGVGPLELLFLFLIILLVFKPEDISRLARSAGRTLNRIYRSDEWRMVTRAARDLRDLPSRLMREADVEELKTIKRDLEETGRSLKQENRNLRSDLSDLDRSLNTSSTIKPETAGPIADAPSAAPEAVSKHEEKGTETPNQENTTG
ncbi:MAG: twin-arginine translocase TatA/TatE family subunit [Anaerolineales bacterium]|nr:twin-arginine translocase TatA/TatE family subunit [Anaerolineales bacterium]